MLRLARRAWKAWPAPGAAASSAPRQGLGACEQRRADLPMHAARQLHVRGAAGVLRFTPCADARGYPLLAPRAPAGDLVAAFDALAAPERGGGGCLPAEVIAVRAPACARAGRAPRGVAAGAWAARALRALHACARVLEAPFVLWPDLKRCVLRRALPPRSTGR